MRFTDVPIDSESAERLNRHGLHLGLVDTADAAAFTAWLHAEGRGFYAGAAGQEEIDEQLSGAAFRRTTGVWDDSAATPEVGRYGFAPAAMIADLEVVTRRATWTGPVASGRVHFVTREQLRDGCRDVFDRARVQTPGDVALDDHIWQRLLGLVGEETSQSRHLRAVRYDDTDGCAQGFAVYRVGEGGDGDFANHTVTVRHLVAATDDAYAGLWRYLLELDLVGTVAAPLRSVDEPLLWQVADHRAVRRTRISDHLWLRVLDVPAALAARSYSAPGRLVLDVRDPLGIADGRFLVEIDAHGAAEVCRVDAHAAPDAAALALSVNELGALYLGGTSARTLVRAGRVTELTDGAADAFDASFRSAITPWLSTWF